MNNTQTHLYTLLEDVHDERAWVRDSVTPVDWLVPVSEACIVELDEVVRRLRQDPLPVLLLAPEQFDVSACADIMAAVRRKLRQGIGLAVVDRIPVDRYTPKENQALCWLLGNLLERTVAQKWDGTMIYDVQDTGRALEYGVRRSVTNLELQFHTDGAFLPVPPEMVGLLCLNPAREGGISRFVSFYTVHNELRRRHPDLLQRLYRPFCWDRQAEHAEGEDKVARHPVFQYDGQGLLARYYEGLILNGTQLARETLDVEGQEALAAIRAIVDAPEHSVEFVIEKGQLQYLNNRQFAHSRTDFRDAEEAHLKRHMIRVWNRPEGRRTFNA